MKRDLSKLAQSEFDVVIVGGGIFGICAARDAALRGLSVALVERGDFANAASSHSFKMVHGGIRYLQHGDLQRLWESNREQRALLRVAPHLVHPLPILVPTYGRGMKGRALLRLGCFLFDLLTCRRNREIPSHDRHVPRAYSVSRQQCLELYPGLDPDGLTGGVVFHDAQMYNPSRLAMAFLRSASEHGAVAGNYLETKEFLRTGNTITGVRVQDRLDGSELNVRGKVVLNAAGGWAPQLVKSTLGIDINPSLTFSRDACFLIRRRLKADCAVAVFGQTKDPDAFISRDQRHLFIVPWRDYHLIGVWHKVHDEHPDKYTVTQDELRGFIDEINAAYPTLELTLNDVERWNAGLVLFGHNEPGAKNMSYGKRSRIVDHSAEHDIDGLVTLVGVRYTTARMEADRVVRLLCKKLGKRPSASQTHRRPVFGGDILDFQGFVRSQLKDPSHQLQEPVLTAALRNYGSELRRILRYSNDNTDWSGTLANSTVLRAEVIHALREEMALKLSDVVFRRTDLASGGDPGIAALEECSQLVAQQLGWSEKRRLEELSEVEAELSLGRISERAL